MFYLELNFFNIPIFKITIHSITNVSQGFCISPFSGVPRSLFLVNFFTENGKNQYFSYEILTTAPINTICSIHTHISPRYNTSSSTMTLKVNEGHWRSLEVIRGQWPSHKLGSNSKANNFQRKLIW